MSHITKKVRLSQPSSAVAPPTSTSHASPSHSLPSLSLSSSSARYQLPIAKSKHFFKWTDRLCREDNNYYNSSGSDEDSDGEDREESLTMPETEGDDFLAARSTLSTRKRGHTNDYEDEDNEDDEESSFPSMALANYDAGDLKTPAYSKHGTPGTAIRMLDGVELGDGSPLSSGTSDATPTGPTDTVTAPRKLPDRDFRKAWARINEIAVFEEDLEYVDRKESIQAFLDRMGERTRKSNLPQKYDQDLNSGPDYAEAHWVSYPGTEESCAGSSDDDDGECTPKAAKSEPESESEDNDYHDAWDATLKEGNNNAIQENIQDTLLTSDKNAASTDHGFDSDFESDFDSDPESDLDTIRGYQSTSSSEKDLHVLDKTDKQGTKSLSGSDNDNTDISDADDNVEAGSRI
ncbi:hypothetical protein EC991_005660 [Linnemannia zychae]|nr:hypothetical protein EC991_005660 [Linnemannia zychae]